MSSPLPVTPIHYSSPKVSHFFPECDDNCQIPGIDSTALECKDEPDNSVTRTFARSLSGECEDQLEERRKAIVAKNPSQQDLTVPKRRSSGGKRLKKTYTVY
jgi:hypothetical protein